MGQISARRGRTPLTVWLPHQLGGLMRRISCNPCSLCRRFLLPWARLQMGTVADESKARESLLQRGCADSAGVRQQHPFPQNTSDQTMTFEEAQADMRRAYYDGATGIVSSATAWLAAGITAWTSTAQASIAMLLVGGMFIFPLSVALSKGLGRSGAHAKGNPLAPLAASGTVWMLLSIPIAYGAALHRAEWFFPAMLLVIGGRYMTFATLYGLRVYYVLGAALVLAGVALVMTQMPVWIGALAGAAIEYVIGAVVFARASAPAVQPSVPTDAFGAAEQ